MELKTARTALLFDRMEFRSDFGGFKSVEQRA
jgi:hypothetical protein